MNTCNSSIAVGFLSLALTACNAGNGDSLNDQGRPIDEIGDVVEIPEPDIDLIKPTLSSIQDKVFTPMCASCHGGANPAAGQDLSSLENSITNLINVTSSNTLFKRVLPGASQDSYLYLKVTGDNRAGSRMPLGQPALDQAQILAIQKWIEDGAVIPESSSNSARVSRVKPELGTQISDQRLVRNVDYIWRLNEPLVVMLWFNKPMNFDYLTPEQISFTAYDSSTSQESDDWLFDSNNISINIINEHTLQLVIPGVAHDVSHINIQLNKSNISTLTTSLGQQLDGDFDGIDGGVFSYDIHF